MKPTKEYLLKKYALDEWLSDYNADKPIKVFDDLTSCASEDEWLEVIETHNILLWQLIEDADWEYIIELISNTYDSVSRLSKHLK